MGSDLIDSVLGYRTMWAVLLDRTVPVKMHNFLVNLWDISLVLKLALS